MKALLKHVIGSEVCNFPELWENVDVLISLGAKSDEQARVVPLLKVENASRSYTNENRTLIIDYAESR
jgi:hypothetical protein